MEYSLEHNWMMEHLVIACFLSCASIPVSKSVKNLVEFSLFSLSLSLSLSLDLIFFFLCSPFLPSWHTFECLLLLRSPYGIISLALMARGRPAKGRASSKAQPAVKASHEAEVKPQKKRTHKKMKSGDADDDDDEDDGAIDVIMQEVKERTRRHKSHHELSETAWKSEQKVASQQCISDQKEEEEVLKSFKQEPEEKEHSKILINRAPVLTLWVAVVAEREGYTFEEGLSFGRFIAALFARTKGQRLGIFEKEIEAEARKAQKLVAPKAKRRVEQVERFEVFGMRIPGIRTETGLQLAVWGGKPIHPNVVKAYLLQAFGSHFDHVKAAMEELARAIPPDRIGKEAYHLYEKFRPQVPEGPQGWGAKGILDLDLIRKLAQEYAKS